MNARDMAEDAFCGTTRAAKLLKVSVGTIHQMVERGELESWRTAGGHRRILLRSVKSSQVRRGLVVGTDANTTVNLVVLASDVDNLTSFKWALTSNVASNIQVTYFTKPMNLVLQLESLSPQLLLMDTAALETLGGMAWFSEFRNHPKFSSVHVVLLSDFLGVREMEAMLINKVNVLAKPLDIRWLAGYVQALATTWLLASV